MARKAKPTRTKQRFPKRVTEVHGMIGQKLRAARLKAGLSQEQLGETLGVSFQQVQKYEKGVNRIDLNRMMECARALNVNLEFFTGPINVKRDDDGVEFDAMMASREGVQIIEAMIEMTPPQRQLIIDIARRLPEVTA